MLARFPEAIDSAKHFHKFWHPISRRHQRIRPARIVGRAGPTDHPARSRVGEDWNEDRPERLAAYVRPRIQRCLPTEIRRRVAAALRRPRVGGLVEGPCAVHRSLRGRGRKS